LVWPIIRDLRHRGVNADQPDEDTGILKYFFIYFCLFSSY